MSTKILRTRAQAGQFLSDQDWPQDWKTTFYKTYPRLPKISLPSLAKNQSANLFKLLLSRESRRNFNPVGLTLQDVGVLLKASCGNSKPMGGIYAGTDKYHRTYPSGGARFPLEVYLVVFQEGGIASGVYHYAPEQHALDVLQKRPFAQNEKEALSIESWLKNASALLVLTSVFERSEIKYGEASYRKILIESGHVGQNFYLVAEGLGLKCSATTGIRDDEIEKLLMIDGDTESMVYALAIGH